MGFKWISPQGGRGEGLEEDLRYITSIDHAKFYVSTLNPLPNPGILQSSRIPLQASTTFFIWSYKTSRSCNFTCTASLLNHCNKQYNLKEYNVSNQAYIYLNWNCTTLRNPSTVKKMFKKLDWSRDNLAKQSQQVCRSRIPLKAAILFQRQIYSRGYVSTTIVSRNQLITMVTSPLAVSSRFAVQDGRRCVEVRSSGLTKLVL